MKFGAVRVKISKICSLGQASKLCIWHKITSSHTEMKIPTNMKSIEHHKKRENSKMSDKATCIIFDVQ